MNAITESQVLSSAVLESYYRTAILYCDKPAFAKAVQKIQTRMGETIQNTEVHTNLEIILENLGLVDRAFTSWHRMIETAGNMSAVKPN